MAKLLVDKPIKILHILWNPKLQLPCLRHFWATSIQTASTHIIGWRSILTLSSDLWPCPPIALLSTGPATPKIYLYLCISCARAVGSVPLILPNFIPLTISVGRYNHEAPHYALFSSPLFPPPSQSQISPSAPHSRTPSNYVIPLTWETKLHTHTKQQAELYEGCKLTQSTLKSDQQQAAKILNKTQK